MFILTSSILNKLCGNALPPARALEITGALNLICPQYGISTADIFHDFIATLIHESGGLVKMEESLNYQAVALTRTFYKWKRISLDDCYRYGRTIKQKANQPAIANIVYGGKWGKENLGNTLASDGWDLRGGGFIQITGRWMYEKFTAYYNKKFGTNYQLIEMAQLVRTDIKISVESSCWVFAIEKKLIDEAIDDKVKEIRKKINGGTLGLDKVQALTAAAQLLIKE